MRCPACAYPNLPTSFTCERCESPLGDRAEIEKTIKRWAEMPASARAEFEDKFRAEQKQFNKYVAGLGKSRLRTVIIGALIGGFCGLFTGWVIVPDIILGGLAGYELNRRGGGQYTGMVVFGIAYSAGFVFKGLTDLLPHINSYCGTFYIAFWSAGALFSLVSGSVFGLLLQHKFIDKI